MKSMRLILSIMLTAATLLVLADFMDPHEAQARLCKIAMVDDDWEPSEGKSSAEGGRYMDDPEYEIYIVQALNLAGFDFDVYEIWPDGAMEPARPTLADLSGYQLVLWNCAANDSAVLQEVEIELLVDYMNLGGKVLLSGQGILDDLLRNEGNPLYDLFRTNILGVEETYLNEEATEIQPIPFGYFGDLLPVTPSYSGLPDPDPDRVDAMFVMPFMDSFMVGTFPLVPELLLPVSSNRFKWQPLHFQSYMAEAIAAPVQRANWLRSTIQWLGFEGDNLYDFMVGYEDLVPVVVTPPHAVALDIDDYHLVFHSEGSVPGETRLRKNLIPLGGDWRIGETFEVTEPGEGSEMVLMSLEGDRGVQLKIRSSEVWPDHFEMFFTLSDEGNIVFEDSFDGLAAGAIFRAQLRYRTDTGSELEVQLTDSLGNSYWNSATIFEPGFSTFSIVARGDGTGGPLPMEGWIDDLFFQGSLSHEEGTDLTEIPPSSGIRLLGAAPNPFNPSTEIHYELERAARVSLTVYDLEGRLLRVLLEGDLAAGSGSVKWDGRDGNGRPLSSGIYLIDLKGRDGRQTQKLVLLK